VTLGDVLVRHALDLDQSPGTSQGGDPAFVYQADAVSVQPIVQVSLTTDNSPGATLPPSITAQLTWNLGPSPTTAPRHTATTPTATAP
jgi:hypothetical protein